MLQYYITAVRQSGRQFIGKRRVITLRCDLKLDTASSRYASYHGFLLTLLAHLLVLALLRGELLQNPALPDVREVLPQGALAGRGPGGAPGRPVTRPRPGPRPGAPAHPVRGEVHASFADVATNRLAPDLLGDDGGAVRLVERL